MPNILAYIVVFSYPLVVVVLFRKLSLPKALIWSILGGYLFLPEKTGIDLPVLPVLDKSTIPALSAAVMVWLKRERFDPVKARQERSEEPGRTAGRPVRVRRQGGRLIILLLIMVIIAPFATYYFNREPVIWGPTFLPAMRLYDSFSMILSTFMALIPFLLARKQLATPEAHREVLKAFVWAGLICSLLILIELAIDGATVGLMLVLTANLIDLIPNSSLVPITWLIAGALAGRYELGRQAGATEPIASQGKRRTVERKSLERRSPSRA
eukprot:g19813.t1